jgi:3-phenylpropionate/trans-cinnamate dioxygenase ferredoxin reductase subunit
LTDIAIVGGSAAGVAAAVAMRRRGFDGNVTIFDQDGYRPYERPPLSKALALPGQDLKYIHPAETYDEMGICLRLGVGVDSLDAERRTVVLSDGTSERYDRLLLATGVSARSLDLPGVRLRNILRLRTADDARRLTARMTDGGPLVVVGGGFIGLELAAVARTCGIDVTVVEVERLPLLRAVGSQIATLLLSLHTGHGVRFLTGVKVSGFRGRNAVEEVILDDGRRLTARTVVVAVGTTANDRLAQAAGVTCGGGVVVDHLGATSNPWLWAAGDVTVRGHRHLRRRCRIEHWDSALRHGEAVGRTMVAEATEETAVPYVWSDQYDLSYQAFGRPEPGDDVILREGAEPDRFLAFFSEAGRVRAVAGVGHPREVRAGRSLVETGQPVPPHLLRDRDTDLRQLSRPR